MHFLPRLLRSISIFVLATQNCACCVATFASTIISCPGSRQNSMCQCPRWWLDSNLENLCISTHTSIYACFISGNVCMCHPVSTCRKMVRIQIQTYIYIHMRACDYKSMSRYMCVRALISVALMVWGACGTS